MYHQLTTTHTACAVFFVFVLPVCAYTVVTCYNVFPFRLCVVRRSVRFTALPDAAGPVARAGTRRGGPGDQRASASPPPLLPLPSVPPSQKRAPGKHTASGQPAPGGLDTNQTYYGANNITTQTTYYFFLHSPPSFSFRPIPITWNLFHFSYCTL